MWRICGSFSLLGVALCLACVAGVRAQGVVGPASGGASSAEGQGAGPGAASVSVPSEGLLESGTALEIADRVFDPGSDSLDFEEGTFNWKGRRFDLVNQRAFRSRFERFLLASPNERDAEYARLMADILDRLSVLNDNSDASILETWELLFRAAEFESDGGNSIIVANQVFNAWRIRKERRGAELSKQELEELREYQQEVVANRAKALRRLRERREKETAEPDEEGGGDGGGAEELPTEAAFRALDLAETEARIAELESRKVATGTQAKLQFQSQIVNFLLQRRFQHALVLSGFYQLLFKGSEQELEVGKEQLASFLPESDLSFTVDTMAFVAREAINDIEKGVEAVNAAYTGGRRMVALERLQETFFLGEYQPALNAIPEKRRRQLFDLHRALLEARELAEAKDYAALEKKAETIASMAGDFPKQRVLSKVETAKSMSDMAVFAASQYRNVGKIDKAREELRTAVEIWPANPSIREFQKETTKLATAGAKGVRLFDELYSRKDYRALYERRMELGFALSEDPERREKLADVVEKVGRINFLIEQSEELRKQENPYAAWEVLEKAASIDPDDARMNRARADLAPRVADFVGHLDRAERLAEAGQPAGALAAYLAAQDIYPASSLCRKGIRNVADQLMKRVRDSIAGAEDA